MKKIIALSGAARSGKDTVAKYLWERYGFTRIAFADPLKQAAQHIFGLSHAQTWDDSLKETVIPYWGISPRQMFQVLGTEAVKPHFGDDIWIKRWAMSYSALAETDDVVVTDARFGLEASYLKDLGGVLVHVVRPGVASVREHVSENGHDLASDYLITNSGTLDQLFQQVDDILVHEGWQP